MLTRKAAEKWLAAHPDEFGKLKVEMPKEAVMQIFSLADVNNDGNISFPEFYRALCLIYFYDKDKGVRAESCFEALDLNNDGKISKSELLHFVKLLKKAGGIPPNDAVLVSLSGEFRPTTASEITEKWMKQFDIDHDSSISREEFCKMAQGPVMCGCTACAHARVSVQAGRGWLGACSSCLPLPFASTSLSPLPSPPSAPLRSASLLFSPLLSSPQAPLICCCPGRWGLRECGASVFQTARKRLVRAFIRCCTARAPGPGFRSVDMPRVCAQRVSVEQRAVAELDCFRGKA
eukprot:739143-Rhodomonas_salina.1